MTVSRNTATFLRFAVLVVGFGLCAAWLVPQTGGQTEPVNTDALSVGYVLTFPEPEHRWMQVEVTMDSLPAGPLSMRMSTSSPGRYARHSFAKNVFEVHAFDDSGSPLNLTRSGMARWDVADHDGTVRFTYRVYGDRVDGTYLAIDETHAHLNVPAWLMWGHGLEDRLATIRFEIPEDLDWKVATQLYPSEDPFTYTAPNLHYLLDSPVELSGFAERSFTVADPLEFEYQPTFRVVVHHTGDDNEVDEYTRDIEAIVRETVAVFGEFPRFETDQYTFIADYLPSASGDAMEHRNSTVLSSSGSIRSQSRRLLGSVSHEFFHVWNVERIRPASLEPFDFEDVNRSGELWLAEGFTNYYGTLILQRAGLVPLPNTITRFVSAINTVSLAPARRFRSAVDMSRLAPFTDAASSIDRTNWGNFFISYYTWGEVLGLGLDLLLRTRNVDSAVGPWVTLDDYMQLLWQRFGRAGSQIPGVVERPYTQRDARMLLGELTNDQAFADQFFDRYVEGRDVIDFEPLFARAGFLLRSASSGKAWFSFPAIRFERGGARVIEPVSFGSPLYRAGVERDDLLVSIDGQNLSSRGRLETLLGNLGGRQQVTLEYRRLGVTVTTELAVQDDPALEVVSIEQLGRPLTADQERFRADWLGGKVEF
ncbi:MAG: peptidase M61 [Acidobacteria bacterium]|nr:peptidase M61 [Acidobacteriota bacterium]|tara:strand:- start:2152 stop:4101 length:1950 start_codon:yes stop_codon:yes gene_type:complete